MREFEKTFGTGRPLRYALEDYWHAVAGDGELGFQWQDKPHRLVYDLLDGMLDARAEIARLRAELELEKRINADYFRRQELMVKDADALRAENAELFFAKGRATEALGAALVEVHALRAEAARMRQCLEYIRAWHDINDSDIDAALASAAPEKRSCEECGFSRNGSCSVIDCARKYHDVWTPKPAAPEPKEAD